MPSLFEALSASLAQVWKPQRVPELRRNYRCTCGRPVFFRNSVCLACKTPLGFSPETLHLHALQSGPLPGSWQLHDAEADSPPLRRCANFDPVGCNWLLPEDESAAHEGLCRACRLNRTIPDIGDADNQRWWRAIEIAKRRLVSQLLGLSLPVRSKLTEDTEHGLMFDFLRSPAGGPPVMTGHAEGLITLNVEEADDVRREQIRNALHEPYRALLGHLRHEVGHYYWDRLVRDDRWIDLFRQRFGDERADYGEALKKHYEQGPPADWPQRHVSAYAASHPWEDWAETWAQYLHIIDALETVHACGLELTPPRPEDPSLAQGTHFGATGSFDQILSRWFPLSYVLNNLHRSLGMPDGYQLSLAATVLDKLRFVHEVVTNVVSAASRADQPSGRGEHTEFA